MTVRCDIVGRDQGGFVADAQDRFDEKIKPLLPEGYHVSWLGMFENLARARTHFLVLIPITILLIYVLLWVTFSSQRAALLVLLGGALRLHRRRAGALFPRHAPEHVQRRGLHRPVRRGDHGRRADGPLDLDLAGPGHRAWRRRSCKARWSACGRS